NKQRKAQLPPLPPGLAKKDAETPAGAAKSASAPVMPTPSVRKDNAIARAPAETAKPTTMPSVPASIMPSYTAPTVNSTGMSSTTAKPIAAPNLPAPVVSTSEGSGIRGPGSGTMPSMPAPIMSSSDGQIQTASARVVTPAPKSSAALPVPAPFIPD